MKITSINVANYLGIQDLQIETDKKVLLVAGFNGAGKSSLADAIRHALLDQFDRVKFKKDLGQFLHKDASAGHVIIKTTVGEFGVSLPEGDQFGDKSILQSGIDACLNPQLFSSAMPADRRRMVFKLMGVKVTPDEISKRLVALGANPAMVDQIRPHLSGGFEPAMKQAAEMARDEKANWRAITGETWGDKKADAWKAEIPAALDYDADPNAIADYEEKLAAENLKLGGLLEKRTAASKAVDAPQNANMDDLRSKAALFAQIQDDLNSAIDIQNYVTDQYAAIEIPSGRMHNTAACPHCAGVVEIKNGKLEIYDQQAFNPELVEAKTKERDAKKIELDAAVAKTQALRIKLSEADAAARALDAIESAAEVVAQPDPASFDAEISKSREKIKEINFEISSLRDLQNQNQEIARKIKDAKNKTESAAAISQAIKSWLLIVDALSPEGIQAELLNEAIEPFNKKLDEISKSSGWPQVYIDSEMNITAGGYPINLRSESEQWRAHAIIAAAIAELSGSGIIMLDRFDVLDIPGRMQFISWLNRINVDQVIAMGTMKAEPAGLPDFIKVVWM